MPNSRFSAPVIFLPVFLFMASISAWGQPYPSKPLRILTVGHGSNTDVATRLIAQPVSDNLGQRLIIENRGIVSIEVAAKASQDGYTLLHYTNPLWLMPIFRDDVSWNVLRDFVPITQTLTSPNFLVVHPSLPVNSVNSLIAFAKSKPGQLNYGSSSTGSGNHVAAELFNVLAGVKISRVNYKSSGQSVSDLISGQIHLMFPAAGAALPHVRNGRLKGLAITSAKQSLLVPGVPTLAEAGLPAYESSSMAALFAPAGTPGTIVNRINEAFVKALSSEDLTKRLLNHGIESVGNTPSELASAIKAEITRMERVAKEVSLRD